MLFIFSINCRDLLWFNLLGLRLLKFLLQFVFLFIPLIFKKLHGEYY